MIESNGVEKFNEMGLVGRCWDGGVGITMDVSGENRGVGIGARMKMLGLNGGV